MRPLLIVTALASGCCIAGALFVASQRPPASETTRNEVPVACAKVDVPAASELTAGWFEVELVPRAILPEGCLGFEEAKDRVKSERKLVSIAAVPN